MIIGKVRQTVSNHLYEAFHYFFTNPKHYGRPRFKTRRSDRQSFTIPNCNQKATFGGDIRIYDNKYLLFPGMHRTKTGRPKNICVLSEPPKYHGRILSATFVMEKGKYYIYILYELPNNYYPLTVSYKAVGIDLGVGKLMTMYDSEFNISVESQVGKLINLYEKVEFVQSQMDKCQKYSNNWKRKNKRFNEIWSRIVNIRNDFLHKLTTMIVKTYGIICIEDLDVAGMLSKDSKLTSEIRSEINHSCFALIRRMLTYKSLVYGNILSVVDRYYPSTQKCSNCGHVKVDRWKLKAEKTYQCKRCGFIGDRDINAARNILREGLRLIQQ